MGPWTSWPHPPSSHSCPAKPPPHDPKIWGAGAAREPRHSAVFARGAPRRAAGLGRGTKAQICPTPQVARGEGRRAGERAGGGWEGRGGGGEKPPAAGDRPQLPGVGSGAPGSLASSSPACVQELLSRHLLPWNAK